MFRDYDGAVVDSNSVRKDFIADHIIKKNPETVGVYRLSKKQQRQFQSIYHAGCHETCKSKRNFNNYL